MARRPIDEQAAIVRDAGYAAIELVSDSGYPLDAMATDPPERRRIRRLIDDAGLTLPSTAGHANVLKNGDAALARLPAGMELGVDLAGPDGPPCLVTMAYGGFGEYEQVRERVAAIFGQIAEEARRRGVVVALEPHVGQALDLPEKCVWLLNTVDSPHLRLN